MNPRYAAYLKTTTNPTNYDFMAFIGQMKAQYAKARGLRNDMPGGCHIEDHDDFTNFINLQVD